MKNSSEVLSVRLSSKLNPTLLSPLISLGIKEYVLISLKTFLNRAILVCMLSMFLILKIDLDALIGILNDPLPVNAETSLEETLLLKLLPLALLTLLQ
ncbi:MAG: hypothetical protein DRN04_12890 [Thermoprotei archaeon]|nr:MAG: hypothetical protein DRN04_12890 [Thermoprotei archaeon]